VEKFQQEAPNVALLVSGHMLKKTCHNTGDRESTETTGRNFIQASKKQELLDDRNNDGHRRVLFLPILEGFVRKKAAIIVKRQVDTQASQPINPFKDWHSRACNGLDSAIHSKTRGLDKASKRVNLTLSFTECPDTCLHKRGREKNEIDIGGGKIQPRCKGTECVDLNTGVTLLESSFQSIHKILADNLLELMGLHPVVERKNLVVKSEQV
jgi:hypothetical protein